MSARTDEEVVAYFESKKEGDWLGAVAQDTIVTLPFALAKPYLVPEAVEEAWVQVPRDREALIERMRGYMAFALGKAEDHRGISAGRSITHFKTWAWMLGDDELSAFLEDGENYTPYGAPMLKFICERFGFPFPDEGPLVNMGNGDKCTPGCDSCYC